MAFAPFYMEDPKTYDVDIKEVLDKYMVIIKYNVGDAWTTGANYHNSMIIDMDLEEYRRLFKKYESSESRHMSHSLFSSRQAAQRFIDECIQPRLLIKKMSAG